VLNRVVAISALLLLLGSDRLDRATARAATDDCRSSSPVSDFVATGLLPAKDVAELFGCRQLRNGSWVTATVGDDRLFVSVLPTDPASESQYLRGQTAILDEIERFVASPAITRLFVYDFNAQAVALTSGGERIPLYGQPLTQVTQWMANYQDLYNEATISYATRPGMEILASYILWYGDRRDSATLTLSTGIHPMAQQALKTMTSYGSAPWPWQLADRHTIDSYLVYLANTIGSPLPSGVAAPETGDQSVSEGNCSQIAYWLGSTGALLANIGKAVNPVLSAMPVGIEQFPIPDADVAVVLTTASSRITDLAETQRQSARRLVPKNSTIR